MAERRAERAAKMKMRKCRGALMKEEWRVGTSTDRRSNKPSHLIGLN